MEYKTIFSKFLDSRPKNYGWNYRIPALPESWCSEGDEDKEDQVYMML
jgi:hypothetical protein